MSGDLVMNNLQVEAIGEIVTIPNNDIAKLMYYLSCVDTVINHNQEGEDDILTDYKHYYLLSENEKDLVLTLVSLFNPLIFIDSGVFIVDPNLVPEGADNEFYKVTDQRIGVHVEDEIMIGGKWVKVLNIMACNTDWLYKFYINPLNNFNRIDYNKYRQYAPAPKPEPIYSQPSSHNISFNSYHSGRKSDDDCCCLIF